MSLGPSQAACVRGGPVITPRSTSPLGQLLPYRRVTGEHPAPTELGAAVQRRGWSVRLGTHGLGETVLALALARALHDATGHDSELSYLGPRPRLIQRCSLPIASRYSAGPHIMKTSSKAPREFVATPEEPPAWLDQLDEERVQVHASLPMRYYLAAEQQLGMRLPLMDSPAPVFRSEQARRPFHVVFVGATSWPSRKDYGVDAFTTVAHEMIRRLDVPWTFTLITGDGEVPAQAADSPVKALTGIDATDSLDVFASAELVVGNDTGLTHLAALTERADSSSPHVIGLYSRHAHTKWTTGRRRHHAVATPFSQILAMADRCPVRDHLDDTLWAPAAPQDQISPQLIVAFAGLVTGWW